MDKKGVSVTLHDVAERAGVSTATVSHVINGSRHVSAQTREKVLLAIEELNYQRNYAARELRTGSSGLIGVLVIDHNPFYTDILRGIEEAVEPEGWKVIVASSGEDWSKQQEIINLLASRRVEGLLMAPAAGVTKEAWERMNPRQPFTVFFDRSVSAVNVSTVTVANHEGCRMAVEHLKQHGHQRIGFVCLKDDISTERERHSGYVRACEDFNIEPNVVFVEATRAGGYQGMETLWQSETRPTAVIVGNNQMTMGALEYIRNAGLAIPDDIALIGFDHQPWMDVMSPTITAVTQPTSEIGRVAVDLLLKHKTGTIENEAEHRVLPMTLRLAGSCGCAVEV